MKTLQINPSNFPLYSREKNRYGDNIRNKCGRDFLYNSLAFYYPNKFGTKPKLISPIEIDKDRLFGIPVPSWLAWTQIQFINLPKYLKSQSLKLIINGKPVNSWFNFVRAIIFSRKSYDDAITKAEECINNNIACGIDISIRFGGLLDHVMFVYGYDEDNLYVFDTTIAPIEYTQVENQRKGFMKLPKEVIKKRWTRFGRVWEVRKLT